MPTARETRDINAILRGLERVTGRVIQKITLDLQANLIESTPVDTGWARANWVAGIGKPLLPLQPEGGRRTSGEVHSAAARQSNATVGVLRYTLRHGRVFMSNNVSYIEALNSGHSAQAPAGFVQQAIRKAVTVDIRGFRG